MQRLAKEYNTNIIAGSVVRKIDDKLYNSTFAIDRMGEIIEVYDKIHLFNYMGGTEGQRITAGTEMKIAHFDFAKVGLTICYDMRYPVFINEMMKKEFKLLQCQPLGLFQMKFITMKKQENMLKRCSSLCVEQELMTTLYS